ncbi:MAG: hypothetical protein FWH27_04650 [Planctomycetaceae bacterium]|nr:hypothetical protein [Planctomycetaceae bacterium]
MKANVMSEQETQKVKLILDWKAGNNGGQTFLPLDVAWEMQGEFATREVHECALDMSALMSP